MDNTKYFRSQIITSNPATKVYWGEKDGKAFDIRDTDIPDGAVVTDLTNEHTGEKPEYVKRDGVFVRYQ